MPASRSDPQFLSVSGEQAWVRLRRHLERANQFWLSVILTADRGAERVLRERAAANRRLRAEPFLVLAATSAGELGELINSLEQGAPGPPGCTWVTGPLSGSAEWLPEWRELLYALNHRRDALRRRLGGLVLVAPPEFKRIAQREASDLWSVLDLLIELPAEPVSPRPTAASASAISAEPTAASTAGLSLGEADDRLLAEAQALLGLPPMTLATTERGRMSRVIREARDSGDDQLAAVLLLAQANGYIEDRDRAAALDLVRRGLNLPTDTDTRIRLLDTAADLALSAFLLPEALGYANESVELEQQRANQLNTPEARRDLSISLNKIGNTLTALGDHPTAHTHYTRALTIREQLAELLGTPQSLKDLAWSLERVAEIADKLGNADEGERMRRRAHDVQEQLARLNETEPEPG